MQILLDELAHAIARATQLPAETIAEQLAHPKKREHGDACIACFELAKTWAVPVPEAPKRLLELLGLPAGIAVAEPMGGFLNFRFDRAYVAHRALASVDPAAPKSVGPVLVEYSSPNIAKPFHVGHLRTTMIGHCLSQALLEAGYPVVQINHLGDWGTQFGFVYAGYQLWGKPEVESVDGLVEIYRKATTLRKRQDEGQVPSEDADKPDVNQLARDYFRRLEAGDPNARAFWEWCLQISLDYLKAAYDRLGIRFDSYRGESFFESRLARVNDLLRQNQVLKEDQGALGVDLGEELGFARIATEDGRSLYLTRDLAAAVFREEEYAPSLILYIVSNQQTLHFRHLKGILERIGHPVAPKIRHLPFGYVPGMSTRGGENISLAAFLDEAVERARQAYEAVRREEEMETDVEEIAEKVAVGSAFFYFLDHTNNKDFQFRWEEALNFQGDSGPYLQYAVARINSIQEKAAQAGLHPAQDPRVEHLQDDESYEILLRVNRFDDALLQTITEFEPVNLTSYLLGLARAFMKGYQSLRVIGAESELAEARLSMFAAVRQTLERGMRIVGVPIVRRM